MCVFLEIKCGPRGTCLACKFSSACCLRPLGAPQWWYLSPLAFLYSISPPPQAMGNKKSKEPVHIELGAQWYHGDDTITGVVRMVRCTCTYACMTLCSSFCWNRPFSFFLHYIRIRNRQDIQKSGGYPCDTVNLRIQGAENTCVVYTTGSGDNRQTHYARESR